MKPLKRIVEVDLDSLVRAKHSYDKTTHPLAVNANVRNSKVEKILKAADFLASIIPGGRKLRLRHFSDEIKLLRAEGCTLKQIVEFLALNGVSVTIAGVSKHLQSTMELDKVGSSITGAPLTFEPSPAVQFQSALSDKKIPSSIIPMKSDTVESDSEALKVKTNVPTPLPLEENHTVTDRQQTTIEQIEGNECRPRCISEPDITNLLKTRAEVPQEVYLVGDLEHPAVPGLLLSLNQRLSRNLLEIEDHQLVRRNETVKEKQFRISWTKPIPSTPTTTAKDFTEMDFSLFRGANR